MPTQPLGVIRILYIEDDPNSRRLVQRLLEAEGYQVHIAEDGLGGLELARKIRPALILTDINISGMTGHEVATKLKQMPETRHVPVIALTAATLATDRERALVAGCDGYITKPIDVDALPRQIKKFLAGKREQVTDDVKLQRLQEYSGALVDRLEATVAELQKANAELRRMDRMKKDFVILAGHELRTPTTLIYGYTHLLKMELQQRQVLDERTDDVIDRITTATKRLNEVVDAVINVSLIDSEQIELSFRPIHLHALLQSIVQQLQPVLQQRNQRLETRDLSALPALPADEKYLRRAITNLIDNAVKYTPDGGLISVDAHLEPEAMHIIVSDTGIGIDRTEQERIFDKFYVLEDTDFHSTNRSGFLGGGLGLGLAVVYGIVTAHGGRIWVESEGQDEKRLPGSRFHILLPLAPPQRSQPAASQNTP
jgi:signal transduction histidine kinase